MTQLSKEACIIKIDIILEFIALFLFEKQEEELLGVTKTTVIIGVYMHIF